MSCSTIASNPAVTCSPRRDYGIVFARVENAPLLQRLLAPGDELVGRARHSRDHDGHFVAGVDLALDVTRDIADAVDIGDRRSAEFHNQTGHGGLHTGG